MIIRLVQNGDNPFFDLNERKKQSTVIRAPKAKHRRCLWMSCVQKTPAICPQDMPA